MMWVSQLSHHEINHTHTHTHTWFGGNWVVENIHEGFLDYVVVPSDHGSAFSYMHT